MRQGLTVLWVGWQFDVPERPGVLRLHVPRARNLDGSPIFGLVRSDWTVDKNTNTLRVSHRNHLPYPVDDPGHPDNILTVRDGREAQRRVVPRSHWRFARQENGKVVPDSTYIYMASGFKAGKIYELVYHVKDPAIVGLGLAAIRDVISYAKYEESSVFPARYGLAAGVSQTGRFLRHFLYQGFNTDEKSRKAYDGLIIMTAGAGRGSFNHRFAQPSRDAHRYSAFFYPTDMFPFTSRTQQDPMQWRSDGLLTHLFSPEHAPKTFYINTGYEYWGRAASLIHTTVEGMADIEPLPHERIYHLASGQHFVGRFPPSQQAQMGKTKVYRGNPLDFSVNYRALLVQLVKWVGNDIPPPPSTYPRNDAGSLTTITKVRFPELSGLAFPKVIHVAYRADYGPRWSQGIIDYQPPELGKPFRTLVSQVDSLGNEIAGIRNVELRVPLATYTPWNLRTGFKGGSHELINFLGTYAPLPRTNREKIKNHDPRPSIASLYSSRDEYLAQARKAAQELIADGFLLSEDQAYVLERAERYWNWIFEQNGKTDE
ncbi:MAG: alpha/beta hydrolase domain-containing protein [bacterium]